MATGGSAITGGAAAAVPCKIRPTAAGFEVNAADLPVPITMESNPAACQFNIQQIEIFDVNGGPNPIYTKKNIGSTSDQIPKNSDAGTPIVPGSYRVFVVPSPAATAKPGDAFGGGTALTRENCAGKTVISVADQFMPMPFFLLDVR
jgi:hypothetical protein